jgi:hypothetical protein
VSTIKLDDSIRKDVSESAHEQIDKIPKRHTLLYLVSLIPTAEQIHAAGKEASASSVGVSAVFTGNVPGFENANKHSANNDPPPIVDLEMLDWLPC